MKNDQSARDFVLSKKFTSFQKLTSLCDYIYDYEILHRKTKSIWSFLVFSTN